VNDSESGKKEIIAKKYRTRKESGDFALSIKKIKQDAKMKGEKLK